MVKQVMKHLANGAGEELAKRASTFLILALMAVALQYMNNEAVRTVTQSNNAALEKAVDRLVASNSETLSGVIMGQKQIIDNQTRIISNTEINTNGVEQNRAILKEQLDTAKETLTILKTKG